MHSYQTRPFKQLTLNSEENNNSDDVTVINNVAKAKRALSSSYSSCEPIPKKLRYALYPEIESDEKEDTSSATSMTYSQDSTWLDLLLTLTWTTVDIRQIRSSSWQIFTRISMGDFSNILPFKNSIDLQCKLAPAVFIII